MQYISLLITSSKLGNKVEICDRFYQKVTTFENIRFYNFSLVNRIIIKEGIWTV